MTFAPIPNADPDPTTQMTWPSSRRSASGSHILKSNYPGGIESPQVERGPLRLDPTAAGVKTLVNQNPKRLTTKDLIFLSISMAGAQIAWTVELGYAFVSCILHSPWLSMLHCIASMLTAFVGRYGTPFLLSLGVSEQLTSLVWLAGPISGLIAQPLIGTSISYDATLSFSIIGLRFLSHPVPGLPVNFHIPSHNQQKPPASPLSRFNLIVSSLSSYILTRFLYSIITHRRHLRFIHLKVSPKILDRLIYSRARLLHVGPCLL